MKLLWLLSCASIALSIVARSAVYSNSNLGYSSVCLRAGAKGNSKQTSLGSSKGGKGKKSNTKYGKTFRRGQKQVPGLHDKLKKLTKQGKSVLNDVYRRAKVLRSSAFEAMLLKATWPSNEPVQPEILGEIIKYSIPAFKFSSADSEDDPYYMTLHKLWTKMYETDWRTVVKSLYILHTILRDCQTDACAKFGSAIKDMAKTRNPKNPDHRYFDVRKIGELDDLSVAAGLQEYVNHYAEYVVYRAKAFTARFDELKSLTEKSSEKKALAVLKKAQQCITLGLKAQATEKKQINAITAYSTKQVAADLRDLFALYGEKIALFTTPGGKYAASAGPKSLPDIAAALKFYQDTEPKLKSYLSTNAKQYVRLRVKIPTDLLDRKNGPTPEALAARLKEIELGSLSGGALGPSNNISDKKNKQAVKGALKAGQCTRHTTKQGTCTRRVDKASTSTSNGGTTSSSSSTSLLRRANRPLTPEEVQASLELSSSFDLPPLSSIKGVKSSPSSISGAGSAHRLACSGSADGACGVRDRVEELLQHSAGAQRSSSASLDDENEDEEDQDEDDQGDDDQEEEEEEDYLQDQDDESDVDTRTFGEHGPYEGEGNFDVDDSLDNEDNDEDDDEDLETGLERSKSYFQQLRRAAKKQLSKVNDEEDEIDEGDVEEEEEEEESGDQEQEEEDAVEDEEDASEEEDEESDEDE